jgi:hypothetical protein
MCHCVHLHLQVEWQTAMPPLHSHIQALEAVEQPDCGQQGIKNWLQQLHIHQADYTIHMNYAAAMLQRLCSGQWDVTPTNWKGRLLCYSFSLPLLIYT